MFGNTFAASAWVRLDSAVGTDRTLLHVVGESIDVMTWYVHLTNEMLLSLLLLLLSGFLW
jgi:hypothetical protein